MVAGDPERLKSAERVATGIPIDDLTWEGIVSAAEGLGISRSVCKACEKV
jgi:LDH2 family malate/lactate/ureidoglycolate dehydrogenase